MKSPMTIERSDTIEVWTLDLPDQRNPISSPEMADAFESAVRTAMSGDVRAIVLTGAGSAFSAGGNIKDMDQRRGLFGGTALEQRNAYRTGIQRIPLALLACDIPLIAAINGPAIGVGFDLTMMCDLRIAGRSAVIAESYVQLGIIPGGGGAWLLPRAIGAARAAELLFTGKRIDAETALEYGIVSRVVDDQDLMDVARELATDIARNAPDAVRVAKRLMREGTQQSMSSHLEFAAALQPLLQASANHREALSSFLERRSPVYPASDPTGS